VLGDPAGDLDARLQADVWWEEITAALSGAVLKDLLGYLLAAKGPITRTELAAVDDDDDALDEFGRDGVAPLETVLASARRFLAGDDDGGLALGHPRFEAYLRGRLFNAGLIDVYSRRLCAYCAGWREAHLVGPYALSHFVEHLAGLGAEADAQRRDVLTDPRYIATKLRELGVDALLGDYPVAPGSAPLLPGATMVTTVARVLRRSA
jgi:hypothetical protein